MSQSAGLAVLTWKETGSNTEYKIGETTLDGSMVLSILEDVVTFKTKLGGNNPTEARIQTGESKFTVDLIDSNDLRVAISTSVEKVGTVYYGGMNNGKVAKTGQLRIHPTYAGSDTSEDIILFKVIAKITDEKTFSIDGKKLIKVEFTLMVDKIDCGLAPTPVISQSTGNLAVNTYYYKWQFSNDWSDGTLSATNSIEIASTGKSVHVNIPTRPFGVNRVVLYKSVNESTWYKKEMTAAELSGAYFNDTNADFAGFEAITLPVDTKAWFYSTFQIGE